MFAENEAAPVVNLVFDFRFSDIVKNLTAESPFIGAAQDNEPDLNELRAYDTYSRYCVDIVQGNKDSLPAFYHRAENAFSPKLEATDEIYTSRVIPHETKEFWINKGLHSVGWRLWRGCLDMCANDKTILSVPPDEVFQLRKTGCVSAEALGGVRGAQRKIKIPCEFDEEGTPLKYTEVWFYANRLGSHVIQYYNKNARFTASVQHGEFFYGSR